MALNKRQNLHSEELLDRLSLFNISYKVPQRIGGLKDGVVYRISDDLVAKVANPCIWQAYRNEPNFLDHASSEILRIEREVEIGQSLYELGISVPHPYGFFKLDVNTEDHGIMRVPGFVMEFIDGVSGMTLTENEVEFNRVMRLYLKEIRKVEELGFWAKDVRPFNFLYIPEEDKVVLIDFANWLDVR